MKYGHFSKDGKEYLITRPDTPKPWVNVISNGKYGLIISQTGGGYSWYLHAGLNRITRWWQDLVKDNWGKYIYLRDDETGDYWSPTWKPTCKKLLNYQCRHGLGYTIVTSTYKGIGAEITYYVPLNDQLEVWIIKLRNESSKSRKLSLFTYFEWNLGGMDPHREFHKLFIHQEFENGVLYATKDLWECGAGHRWNRGWEYVAYLASSVMPVGCDTDKEAFIGMYRSEEKPIAVEKGRCSGPIGRGDDAIGSLHLKIRLASGEEKKFVVLLGIADRKEEALPIISKHKDMKNVEKELERVKEFWNTRLQSLIVETPDKGLDKAVNFWYRYQALSCRLWGRTAYWQPAGGYGFRDQLQDCLAALLIDTLLAKKQIKLHAMHQFRDGTVHHWWHPIEETGPRLDISDDRLWLPFTLIFYLKETGDKAILDEEVGFLDGGKATIFEHAKRAIEHTLTKFSSRGLPLIGDGDWNDGMNSVGLRGKGESVWTAHFLYCLLKEWATVAKEYDKSGDSQRYLAKADDIKTKVNKLCWDGEWYIRATMDNGKPIGSKACKEGKIFLNAQTWAVISGTAPENRAEICMDSVKKNLETEFGFALMLPAYSMPNSHIGYLTRYAPGTRENGAIYQHANAWGIIAEAMLGRGDTAYEIWKKSNFIDLGKNPDRYKGEPYVNPGNIDGPDSARYGMGSWTWYTGSAAWTFRALTDWLLGIRPEFNGLLVDPCIPKAWKSFKMTRRFRNAVYKITVENPDHVNKGVKKLIVDGRVIEGKVIPIFEDDRVHQVRVIMG